MNNGDTFTLTATLKITVIKVWGDDTITINIMDNGLSKLSVMQYHEIANILERHKCVNPKHTYKKDDVVLVRDFPNEEWHTRYATGYFTDTGDIVCYKDGRSSLTSTSSSGRDTTPWLYHKPRI